MLENQAIQYAGHAIAKRVVFSVLKKMCSLFVSAHEAMKLELSATIHRPPAGENELWRKWVSQVVWKPFI
jgi:hypothetical protein